jgi:tetratricopeptide (TPR) repeat protein
MSWVQVCDYWCQNYLAIIGIAVSLFGVFYAFRADEHAEKALKEIKTIALNLLSGQNEIKTILQPLALNITKKPDSEKTQEDKAIIDKYDEVNVNPETAEEWFLKGYTFGEQKDYEKAIDCYNKAIDLKPDYANAYFNMGLAYGKNGNETEAINCIKKAAQLGLEVAKKWLHDNGY